MKWKHQAATPAQTKMNSLMGRALDVGSRLVKKPTSTMNKLKANR
jgi:hypothetical protein